MKTTITVQSIHDGVKLKLTFENEKKRDLWIEKNASNYILKSFKVGKTI